MNRSLPRFAFLVGVSLLGAAVVEAETVRYATRRECRDACAAPISHCREQAPSGRDRRRCKKQWIKACSRFLGLDVCSPPDLRGTWEFNASVTDAPNPCAEPVGPVLFSIDTQGSFDLIGVGPISGAFSDMPFSGTMIINPELGVGFSVQGHGDQFSPCYLARSIGAGTCRGACERNGSYTVRKFCNGSPAPVCQWGAAGTLFRRP
jgi:hypothetical protein